MACAVLFRLSPRGVSQESSAAYKIFRLLSVCSSLCDVVDSTQHFIYTRSWERTVFCFLFFAMPEEHKICFHRPIAHVTMSTVARRWWIPLHTRSTHHMYFFVVVVEIFTHSHSVWAIPIPLWIRLKHPKEENGWELNHKIIQTFSCCCCWTFDSFVSHPCASSIQMNIDNCSKKL